MVAITDFISQFKGGARADRFRAIISYPALVGTPNVPDYIMVHTAMLPGSSISPAIVFFQGRQIPLMGDRQLEPLSLTLLNDTSYSHRGVFEKWMNAINSHAGNIQASANYLDLVGTIEVQQLDRDDTIIKSVKFLNCFPDALSQIDLDYSMQDQVQSYSVGLAYSHWTSDTTS